MNGRLGADRATVAAPGRVVAAATVLGIGVIYAGFATGPAAAADLGGPSWPTPDVDAGWVAVAAPRTCGDDEPVLRKFPQVRHGHARGTMLAV